LLAVKLHHQWLDVANGLLMAVCPTLEYSQIATVLQSNQLVDQNYLKMSCHHPLGQWVRLKALKLATQATLIGVHPKSLLEMLMRLHVARNRSVTRVRKPTARMGHLLCPQTCPP
jgi:hypothetical protein